MSADHTRRRITRLAAAVPLLFTFLYATCPNGREGHVFTLKLWSVRVTANTCSWGGS